MSLAFTQSPVLSGDEMMMNMRFPAALLFSCTALLAADADLILYHGKIITLNGLVKELCCCQSREYPCPCDPRCA